MPELPPVTQEFVAEGRGYSDELRQMARDADRFGDKNSKAALAARRMGIAAKEAADKAARAMSAAGEAAEKLAMGEIHADEAAQAEAKALRELERSALKAAEAEKASAHASAEYAAAQRIAAAQNSKLSSSQRKEIQRLAAEFPELKAAAKAATTTIADGFETAETSLSTMTKVGIPAAVVVVSQLPTIAAAAGGAMSLAFGGAFSALAMKAQAGSASAKRDIGDLETYAGDSFRRMTKPFQGTWHDLDIAAHEAIDSIEPSMTHMFADLAKANSGFFHSVGNSVGELAPMFDSAGRAYSAVLGDLDTKMPEILNNVSTGVTAVFDAVEQNPQALTSFVEDLSMITRAAGTRSHG